MVPSPISCRITQSGKSLVGIPVILSIYENENWKPLGTGSTDEDGYTHNLLPVSYLVKKGLYKLGMFQLPSDLLPQIYIEFKLKEVNEVYHFLVLFGACGYSINRIPIVNKFQV